MEIHIFLQFSLDGKKIRNTELRHNPQSEDPGKEGKRGKKVPVWQMTWWRR